MGEQHPVHWLKIGLDVTSCLVLFLFFESLKVFAKPYKSYFYCNDYSISMPFKRSTVTNGNLILLAVLFPFVLLIGTEVIRTIYARRRLPNVTSTRFVYKIRCFDRSVLDVSEQLGNLYVNCGAFFFGLASVAVVTDFVKVLVGRLRPNFLDVCQPNVNPYKDICAKLNRTYIVPDMDFKCTSRDLPSIDESRLSFPSGHSSLMFYSMLFLIMFIERTWKCSRLGLMPRLVQLGLFSLAVFVALSRIVDNKHHASDVMAGAVLGSLGAFLSFAYLTDLLKKNDYRLVQCFSPQSQSQHHALSSIGTATTTSHSLDDDDDIDKRSNERLVIVTTATNGTQTVITSAAVPDNNTEQTLKESFSNSRISLNRVSSNNRFTV